jgi:hypothetical protein
MSKYRRLTVQEVKLMILMGTTERIEFKRVARRLGDSYKWWGISVLLKYMHQVDIGKRYFFRIKE